MDTTDEKKGKNEKKRKKIKKKEKIKKTLQLTICPKEKIKEYKDYNLTPKGRSKSTIDAERRMKELVYTVVNKSAKIGLEHSAGPEAHLITRNKGDWDTDHKRHGGGSKGKAGLTQNVFNLLDPEVGGGKLQIWVRTAKNNFPAPVYNIPSNVCKEVKDRGDWDRQLLAHFKAKHLWYLCVKFRFNNTMKFYSLGLYENIPTKYYYPWNKNGNENGKWNSVHFRNYNMGKWPSCDDDHSNLIRDMEEIFG